MLDELKAFFEESDLAKRAAHSLKDGREIALLIEPVVEPVESPQKMAKPFIFVKKEGRNEFLDGLAKKPDVSFFIPEASAHELITQKFDDVGQVGLHIFDKMLSNDPKRKIRVKLHVGFMDLMTGGYFGVLAAGGSDVAKFLAAKGFASLGKLKDLISNLRA